MNFNTKGQEVKKGGISKGLNPGVVFAHIYDAVVRTASTGKKQLQLLLEGPALPDFEGWDIDRNDPAKGKFLGQSGWVNATIYMDETKFGSSDLNVNEIVGKLILISDEVGAREQMDAIAANTIEEWVQKAVEILKGKDLYFFLAGTQELYQEKVKTKLQLPKFKYASADKTKLDEFDKNNKYHFKPLEGASTPQGGAPVSDFDTAPFDVQ